MIDAIVFDAGRTLMEYRNMPNSWQEYYPDAIRGARDALSLDVTEKELSEALEVFKLYSPRLHYREVDYTPEHIFAHVTGKWRCEVNLSDFIREFFAVMKLEGYVYPETIGVLKTLREKNIKIAVLTDVATGMPDEMHKSYFNELLPYFDLYVSSLSCGMRKPNPKGLEYISECFGTRADCMLMVGDEPKDIEVAKRFGCRSCLIDRYNSNADFGQDITVKNLSELINDISGL